MQQIEINLEQKHVDAIVKAIEAITDLAILEIELANLPSLSPFNKETNDLLEHLNRKLIIAKGFLAARK